MITSGVLITLICCATVLALARVFRISSGAQDTLDQHDEDLGVFQVGLENHAKRLEALEKLVEDQGRKLGQAALQKVRL